MALTGEAKREWRRKNREKHRLYNQQWARDNPDKVAAHNERAKAKSASRPEVVARRMYATRLAEDELFAIEVKDRKRQAKLRPRRAKKGSHYFGGWTMVRVGFILWMLKNDLRSPWKKKCESLARAARFRFLASKRARATVSRRAKPSSWADAVLYSVALINSDARHGETKASNSIEYRWKKFCAQKAGQIKLRAKVDEVRANEKR